MLRLCDVVGCTLDGKMYCSLCFNKYGEGYDFLLHADTKNIQTRYCEDCKKDI